MQVSEYFRIHSPQVISETIDGETIIINLESGHYFSLNHSGGQVWNDIQAGFSVSQIQDLIQRRYPDSDRAAGEGLKEFFQALQKESLILPIEAPAAKAEPSASVGPADRPFEKPALQKYEDMQDLLLLDPIHEVDEMGWPIAK